MLIVAGVALFSVVLLAFPRPNLMRTGGMQTKMCSPSWLAGGVFVVGAIIIALYLFPAKVQWILSAGVVGFTGWKVATSRRASARCQRHRAEVVSACQALAGQLRVGLIPGAALERVALDSSLLAGAASAHKVGADVAAALREQAKVPGCAGLQRLASAWQLCEVTGASIAGAAMQVAQTLRQEQSRALAVEAELAAPRATGRLLVFLPVIGIAMGYVAGGDPGHFLLATGLGRWLVLGALTLACLGLLWTEQLSSGDK